MAHHIPLPKQAQKQGEMPLPEFDGLSLQFFRENCLVCYCHLFGAYEM